MPDYRRFTDDELLELRNQVRSNLADLTLKATKYGELAVPLELTNQIDACEEQLAAIDAEFKRRAHGVVADPPELVDIRQKIERFVTAIADESDPLLIKRWNDRLADLREQEAAILRQHEDYLGTLQAAAANVAVNLERDTQTYHKQQEQQRHQRERFVNRRAITLDQHLFRDRVNEQQQIMQLLAQPQVRLIQVVGTGGMGKTALVSMILLTLDQQKFTVDANSEPFHTIIYRSHKDTGLTFEQIVSDLRRVCPEHDATLENLQKSGDYTQQAQILLETLADVRVLLVLDNCETLMNDSGTITDSGIAALLAEVLKPQHAWRLLVTSRRELAQASPYQRKVPLVDGLPFEDAKQFLLDYDADNSTALVSTPDEVLKPIIERLHGRPRLLESLVGVLRQSTYTPEQLLAKPETLENITKELHDWLSIGEQAIVRALAVFGVPAPREALEFLLLPSMPSLALDQTLARLTRNGVINQTNASFSLHSIDAEVALRAGGRESGIGSRESHTESSVVLATSLVDPQSPSTDPRLPSTDSQQPIPTIPTLHKRTADYYEQRELPREQWRTIDDLTPQIARVEHLTAAGLYDAAAEILGEIDGEFMMLWGYSQRIIDLREPLQGRLSRAWLQMNQANSLGLNYNRIGRVREAIQQYQTGLTIAQRQRDRGWQGVFLGNLGSAYADLGEVQKAINYYEQRIAIAREIGDRRGEGSALGNLGSAYADLGEVRTAIEYYEQRIAIAREIGDRRGEGTALGNLGLAYADLGEVRKAIEYYEQRIAIAREIGDRRSEGTALGNLGSAYASLGEVRTAIGYHEQRIAIAREIGDRRGEGSALGNLGSAYADLGEVRTAIGYYEQALGIHREIGDRRGEGTALTGLGSAYADLGEVRTAIDYYEQVLVIVREIGDRSGEGIGLENIAVCYIWLNEVSKARELLEQAHTIDTEIANPYTLCCVKIEQGNLARLENNPKQALERYQTALALDHPQTAGKAVWLCGIAEWLLGNDAQAQVYWQDARQRCANMLEVIEYQYIAALIEVAQAIADPSAISGDPLASLREVVAKHPIPLRLMEAQRDLKGFARAESKEQRAKEVLDGALGIPRIFTNRTTNGHED